MTSQDLIFLCALFVGFLAFAGYVAENWPKLNPLDDDLYERRSEGHFRDMATKR